jgi:hypothetical protein
LVVVVGLVVVVDDVVTEVVAAKLYGADRRSEGCSGLARRSA